MYIIIIPKYIIVRYLFKYSKNYNIGILTLSKKILFKSVKMIYGLTKKYVWKQVLL